MPGISAVASTYDVPNYVGEIFEVSPSDTPLLSAIGGLTGGEQASATYFTWQGTDLRRGEDDRQRLEGADAPSAESRTRFNMYNVVEVHHESVGVTYTKLAATSQVAAVTPRDHGAGLAGATQPVQDELGHQTTAALKSMALDIEASFLTGEFANPADNTAPRRTRGLIQAIEGAADEIPGAEANVIDAQGAAVTEDAVLDLMQMIWDAGGIREDETRTAIVNSTQKRALTRAMIRERGYQEMARDVGGVNLSYIETDFGRLNLMLDRWAPRDMIVVASLDELAPVFLPIPDRGFLFQEALPTSGSTVRTQLYGEIGLKYGLPIHHGLIKGLPTGAGAETPGG
ncbi:SU10 major capsid protein [Nocardiopsis alba]|uniref:SU10 major capsid protein n=1 Tax=Nocardiopsis alba TaxID=53437 RepID=UPI0035D54F9F